MSAFPLRQIPLDLRSPADHYDMVAGSQIKQLIAWTPRHKRHWHALNVEVARDQLAAWTNEPDIYVTPNEFHGWRLIRLGAAFNALYVDIDFHDGEAFDPARVASEALGKIEAAGIPTPCFIVYTGRGVHIYWLLQRTPWYAMPRWQNCQRALLKLIGGDRMSADATRVLRVVGTRNPKADFGRRVVSGELLTPQRYEFDWLADQILPYSRAQIRDLRAERAKRAARNKDHSKKNLVRSQQGGVYHRWWLVYEDLWRIYDAKWFGFGVEKTYRDRMLFLMANALAWFTRAEALEDEIAALARSITPSLDEPEARSYCTSIIARARQDAAEAADRNRYHFKRETLWAWVSDIVPASLVPDLRAIVPDEVREERRQTREKARDRVAEGRYVKHHSDEATRASARLMRAQGRSFRDIARELGVTHPTVAAWCR